MENVITISDISRAKQNIEQTKQLSEIIIKTKNPELNYQAILILGINKTKHLEAIIEGQDPLYNYKCIKHCMKTETLTIEEKKLFITRHSEIVLNSNNKKLIKELQQFLKYNKIQGKQSHIGINNTKRKRR